MMKQTPLHRLHQARGADLRDHHGWAAPYSFSTVKQEYDALQEGAALMDLSFREKLVVTGRDRLTWLQGQVTQDLSGLQPGQGAYAAVITPQGKMVADPRIFVLEDRVLVDAPAGLDVPLAAHLDRYLIMERAEIADHTEDWALLSVQGPLAHCAVGAVLGRETTEGPPWSVRTAIFAGRPVHVARAPHCGEDAFDLFVEADQAPGLWGAICRARREFGVHSVGLDAYEVRRVEAGVPRWGAELDGRIVPPEARLDHAVSYTKGCYVGQEIMARIHARGHVNNLLAGLTLEEGPLPPPESPLYAGDRQVGRTCTALRSLHLDRPIALAYVRREFQEPGQELTAAWEGGRATAAVTPLPFVPDDTAVACCP